MKKHDIIMLFVIMLLVVFAVWQRQSICELRNAKPETDTVIVESVHYDTIYPTPITLVETDTVTLSEVDTVYFNNPVSLGVAKKFFSYNYYDDVLKDDSTGYVRIKSTVHKNTLEDRELFFEARCQDKIITRYENKRELYFMPSLMASPTSLGVHGSLKYKDKKYRLYGLNFGFFKEPFVGLGLGFRF